MNKNADLFQRNTYFSTHGLFKFMVKRHLYALPSPACVCKAEYNTITITIIIITS